MKLFPLLISKYQKVFPKFWVSPLLHQDNDLISADVAVGDVTLPQNSTRLSDANHHRHVGSLQLHWLGVRVHAHMHRGGKEEI